MAWEAQGLWRPTTLWDRLVEVDPSRIAVVCQRNGEIEYGTLLEEAVGLASAWHARGVGPGDVVALQLPNWYEMVLAHVALTRLGAITLPILPIYGEQELRYIIEAAQAKAVVGAPSFRSCPSMSVYERLHASIGCLKWIWTVDDGNGGLRAISDDGTGNLPPPPSPDDVTIVMATSGTTGEPKLVMHSHRSTVGGVIDAVAIEMGLTSSDVVFMPSPLAHATGLQYGIRMSGILGAKLVLQDRWEPSLAADLIARHKATWTIGATPFLYDLVELDASRRSRLTTLRSFVCGGAPIPERLAERAIEVLPQMSLMAAWGMSETGIVTLVRPGDPLEKVTGSDGRPVPGWEVRVVTEDGKAAGPGEPGEVLCRGAALFHGYLGRPEFTSEAAGDGWLRSGDLGRWDGDGYLRCLGRIKDLIIRGGLNISAVEVETHVRRHPSVVDVAIVGLPDERLGERICAFIIAEGDTPTVQELGDFLLQRGLAKQKLPERIVALKWLPTTPTGKVKKFLLRKQAEALGGTGAGAEHFREDQGGSP